MTQAQTNSENKRNYKTGSVLIISTLAHFLIRTFKQKHLSSTTFCPFSRVRFH